MASPFDSPLLLASAEPELVPQYSKLFGRGTPTTSGQASWISNSLTLTSNLTSFTFSCWLKRSLLNPNVGVTIPEVLFQIRKGANGIGTFDTSTGVALGFQKNAENMYFRAVLATEPYVPGGVPALERIIYQTGEITFNSFLDASSWCHIVFNYSTSTSTLRLYVNGVSWESLSTPFKQVSNTLTAGSYTATYGAGMVRNAASAWTNSPFHGYISESYFLVNQILGPEYFGQLDTKRGAPRWVPKRFSGTYNTTADHYLQFDNVENSIAWKDSSPNGNTFGQDYIATTAWTAVESNRVWESIAMSSDGRYQTAVATTRDINNFVNPGLIYTNNNFGQGAWTAVGISQFWKDIAMSSDGRYQTAVSNGLFSKEVYRSNDFGASWSAITPLVGSNGGFGVAMSSDGRYQTIVQSGLQIYINDNYGQGGWTAVESNRTWRKVAMSADGKYQAAVESGGRIYINDTFGLGTWTGVESFRAWVSIAMSADGKYLTAIVASGDPNIAYVNSNYGQGAWTPVAGIGIALAWSDVAMSSDGKYQTIVTRGTKIFINSNYGLGNWTTVESDRVWNTVAMSSDGRYQTAAVDNGQIYRLANVVNNLTNDQTVDVPYTIVSNVVDTGLGKTVRGNYSTLLGSAQSYNGAALQPWFDQGNLQVSPVNAAGIGYQGGTSYLTSPGTMPITSGKWYFEATVKAYTDPAASNRDRFRIGILSSKSSDSQSIFENTTSASAVGNSATSYAIRGNSASSTTLLQKITNSVATTFTWPSKTALAANDVLMCAVDMDSKQVWFGVNGFWCSDTVFNSTNISWDFLGWSNGFPGGDNWVNVSLSKTGKYIIAARNDTVTPLIVSSNYGLSFSAKTTGTFMKSAAVSNNGQYMLACNNGNLWLSTNYGETFFIITAVGTGNFSSVALSEDGRYQTVVVDGGRIWRSETWGQTWTQVGDASNRAYKAVAMSANGTFQLAAVAPGQLWRSTNSGSTWTAVSITSWNAALWTDVAVSSDGLYQAAVASSSGAAANTGRIFRSVNSGSTWAATGDTTGRPYSGIAMDATGRYVLVSVLATGPGFDQGSNVRFSTDFGVTFNAINISISWYSAAMSSTGNIIVVTGQQGIQANRLGMEAQQIQETGYTFTNNAKTPAAFPITNLTEAVPAVSFYRAAETTITNLLEVNFGQRSYTYQAPSGYKSLCTSNLPEPLYPLASNFFDGKERIGIGAMTQLSALSGIPSDIVISSDNKTAYIPGSAAQAGILNVVNLSSSTIQLNINQEIISNAPIVPRGAVITPDDRYVYIADSGNNQIIKYDTDSIVFTSLSSNQFNSIRHIDITPDGRYLYVTSRLNDKLIEIDLQTNAEIVYNTGFGPLDVKIAPNSKYLVVTNRSSSTATFLDLITKDQIAIDLMNLAVPSTGTLGSGPSYIAITSDSKKVYITSTGSPGGGFGNGGIVEVTIPEVPEPFDPLTVGSIWSTNNLRYLIGDTSSRFPASTLGINIQSDDASLYVSNSNGGLALYDLTTNTVTSAFPTSIHAFKCSNDDKFILRCNRQTPSILFREDVRDVQNINFTPQLVWTKQSSGSVLADHHFAYSQPELTSPTNSRVIVAATNTVAVSSNANNGAIFNFYEKGSKGAWTPVESVRNWRGIAMSSDGRYQTAVVASGQIYINSNFRQGTWTPVESVRNWRGIAMSSDGRYQTAVVASGQIYINSNFGQGTWTPVESNRAWEDVAISSDGKYQTAVVLNGQIYINSNFGQGTWTAVANSGPWQEVAMSSDGKYQTAVDLIGASTGYIYLNDNYGQGTWTAVEGPRNYSGVAMSSDGKYQTAVVVNGQIYINSNYGQGTWTPVESNRAWQTVAMSSDGKYRTAVVASGQIYINSNFGQGTWTPVESNRAWEDVAISSDGKYQTAVVSGGGQIYLNGPYFANNGNNKYSLRYTSSAPLSGRTTVKNNSYNDYVWGSDPNILSITEYTGNGGANRPIPHTLGNIPDWVLIKRKTSASGWVQFVKTMAANSYFTWGNAAAVVNSAVFTTGSWTGSDVVVGTDPLVNASGVPYVMFAFKEIPGISSIGSYRTPYSTTWGTLVNTGFAPEFVLIKSSVATQDWIIFDNFSFQNVNSTTNFILPNSNANSATAAGAQIDILSNGFKIRGTNARLSVAGGTFYYIAFAKSPFKYANGGRPFGPIL